MESGQKMEREKDNLNFEETELRLGLPGGRGGGGGGGGGAHEGDHHHHHHHVVKNNNSTNTNGKRGFEEDVDLKLNLSSKVTAKPLGAKAQVVGWPPVRSFRKNILAVQKSSGEVDDEDSSEKISSSSMNVNAAAAAAAAAISLVKVSMDGAPYLRKVDLKMYNTYQQLSHALANMFSSFTIGKCGSEGMKDLMNEGKLMDLLSGSDYVPTYEDKDGDWMLIGDVPWEMFVDSCKRVRIMKGTEAIGLAPRAMAKCKNRS